jgi:hypothetical protein
MLRNSTLQPMCEFGSGGLNLNVRQLVDRPACNLKVPRLKQTSKWSVLLPSSCSTSSEKEFVDSCSASGEHREVKCQHVSEHEWPSSPCWRMRSFRTSFPGVVNVIDQSGMKVVFGVQRPLSYRATCGKQVRAIITRLRNAHLVIYPRGAEIPLNVNSHGHVSQPCC